MEKTPKFETPESKERAEKGRNVSIRLKIIRHGERTTEGELTDYGRQVTSKIAKEKKTELGGLDAVKAYGSQAGPKGPMGMGRSLETADIYAEEVAGEEKFKTRGRGILSYETLVSKTPYNHTEIYNANLPENFDSLSDEEKAEAARKAQSATVNHLFSLDSPEAKAFKKEVAGAFAVLVESRAQMTSRLKNNSKVLMLAGTHGPMPELFLQQALIRKLADGKEVRGFENIDEIGGPLDPSESIDVLVERNDKGELEKLRVEFDNPARPKAPEMYLDPEKLEELSQHYKELHKRE